jgi:hypothetical protein
MRSYDFFLSVVRRNDACGKFFFYRTEFNPGINVVTFVPGGVLTQYKCDVGTNVRHIRSRRASVRGHLYRFVAVTDTYVMFLFIPGAK